MVGKKNNNFLFTITFAPEKKLLGVKLKKTIGDHYRYALVTTKTITLKPLSDLDFKDVDDETTRFSVCNKVFKVLNDTEYKGSVTGYDDEINK